MNTPTDSASSPRISPSEWDDLRLEFRHSVMVDTSLAALAENIDGCVWPITGPPETPASYIALGHAEALARLASVGQPPSALDLLVVILRGTIAFDESFGEMVEIAGKAEAEHDPVPRNLERLGIPIDFPVRLCAIKPNTLQFCQRERIEVLTDFLTFARGASRQMIIGGEFRGLLNAITHVDEATIAKYLPFRTKTSGLHFVESLALLIRELDEVQRERLITQPASLPPEVYAKGEEYAVYFKAQVEELRAALTAGTPLSRLVAPLDDLLVEPTVASILRLYLTPALFPRSQPGRRAAAPRGFFQRFLSLFGK